MGKHRLQRLLEAVFQALADRYVATRPTAEPSSARLAAARIVSHRGEHDNRLVPENALAAFDRADLAGVWGLELDLRWTADGRPVVFHDEDLRRLAGCRRRLCDLTLRRARSIFPSLATLPEVVARYGRRRHLMIEVKNEVYRDFHLKTAALADTLAPLEPVRDYHLLSLDPKLFAYLGFAPPRALVPIAWGSATAFSRMALERGYGGVCGHFLLVGQAMLQRHHRHHQQVGCGMVASARGLYREICRGTDWIFSNRAAALTQPVRRQASR